MEKTENIVGDYWAAERGSGKPYSWLQSPTLLAWRALAALRTVVPRRFRRTLDQ